MKGYNLMVGVFVMATIWTVLALIGNAITPASYASSILANVFFGAFFVRVLMDTGIAATLIRRVVVLGWDRPRLTMSLLCIVTAIIFMSKTGIGPVISIAVIVLPIEIDPQTSKITAIATGSTEVTTSDL